MIVLMRRGGSIRLATQQGDHGRVHLANSRVTHENVMVPAAPIRHVPDPQTNHEQLTITGKKKKTDPEAWIVHSGFVTQPVFAALITLGPLARLPQARVGLLPGVVVHHATVGLPHRPSLEAAFGEEPVAGVGAEPPSHDAVVQNEAHRQKGGDDLAFVDGEVFRQLGPMGRRNVHA